MKEDRIVFGVAIKLDGVVPIEHCITAPVTTCLGITDLPTLGNFDDGTHNLYMIGPDHRVL